MNGPQPQTASAPVPQQPASPETPRSLKQLTDLDLQRIRELIARASARNSAGLLPDPPPRYDDLFFQGTEWLDTL